MKKSLFLFLLLLTSIGIQAQTFPVNDAVCDALALPIDGIGILMQVDTATVEAGETVVTPLLGDCTAHYSWCIDDGITGSVWFTFVAPASGALNISTCGSDFDSQIAVYEVTNCQDFNSFTLLDATDDTAGDGIGGNECGPADPDVQGYGLASELNLGCLSPGQTYYLLVDRSIDVGAGLLDVVATEITPSTVPVIDSISVVAPTCVGGNDGTATVHITGYYPLEIQWNNGASTITAGGFAEGETVSVSVINDCGLSATATAAIPFTISASNFSTTLTTYPGYCGDGYASVLVSGGVEPYNYEWDNGATDELVFLQPGTYTVSISDACGTGPLVETATIIGLADAGPDQNMTNGTATLGGNPTGNSQVRNSSTYSIDQTISSGIACRGNGFISDNGFIRTFDLATDFGITTDYLIDEVEVAIFSATSGNSNFQPLECRIYTIDNIDLSVATMSLVSTIPINIPNISTPLLWSIPTNYLVPANELIAIEIFNPDALEIEHELAIGINETPTLNNNPTWIVSQGCGISTPTLMSEIGFADELVINIVQNGPYQGNYTYSWTPTADLDDATAANPVFTTSQLGIFDFTLVVTDDEGCSATDMVTITNNQGCVAASVTINSAPDYCMQANGAATATSTGGESPYTYMWDTGATSSSISGLAAGAYSLTVTDAVGCVTISTTSVAAATTQLSILVEAASASCDQQDGSATATVVAGATSPTFLWNTGQSTPTIGGLGSGWYSVTVSDPTTGCRKHQNIFVDQDISCKARISGYVINDQVDPDCVDDTNSLPLANRILTLRAGGTTVDFAFTDGQGYYEFLVDSGSYELELDLRPTDLPICPATNTVTINVDDGQTYSEDFYLDYQDIADLSIFLVKGPARPGFQVDYRLVFCNNGTDTVSGFATLAHDLFLTNFVPDVTPDSYDAVSGKATWSFSDLLPTECRSINIDFVLDVNTPIGTLLTNNSSVFPIDNDYTPDDNLLTCHQTVTGSYDPNDKQNFSARDPFGGDVHPDTKTYHYQIRFQNTGTDTAFTVVIRDEIDPNFDITSIRPIDASHDYTMDIENGRELVFFFEDIMLADSNVNEAASHGYIYFTIDRVDGLPLGTTIQNEANIYFDFNSPILTNLVINTLAYPDGIRPEEPDNFALDVHPNPFGAQTFIELKMDIAAMVSLRLFDIKGQEVTVLKANERLDAGRYQVPLSTGEMVPGVYFLQLQTNEGILTRKLIKL